MREKAAENVLRDIDEGTIPYGTLDENLDLTPQGTQYDINVDTFAGSEIQYKRFSGEYTKTAKDIDTNVWYSDSRQQFVDEYIDDPDDLGSGEIAENFQYKSLYEKKGYDPLDSSDGFYKEEMSPTQAGIDGLAKDGDTFVITEAKYSANKKALGYDQLKSDAKYGKIQLDDDWLRGTLDTMREQDTIGEELAQDLEDAIESGKVRKEVVFVRDTPDSAGRTLRNPDNIQTDISRPGISNIDIIHLPQ